MAVKKQIYIEAELDWADNKLKEWKSYIDSNPIYSMKDRMDYKETKNGGLVKTVIASIEAQGKFQKELLHEYLLLLPQVKALREAEEAKKKDLKGGDDRPIRMSGE